MKLNRWNFNDQDLRTIIHTVGATDFVLMMRTLREDEEILEGMLADPRLFKAVLKNPEILVRISPRLFFAVLLARSHVELAHQSYTLEKEARHQVVVFDSNRVVQLLARKEVRIYLAELLTSFVRINSTSLTVRVKAGIWRKYRFSDFDIRSLMRYSEMVDPSQRFQPLKRIADICLFISGFFNFPFPARQDGLPPSAASEWPKEQLTEYGKRFYRNAAEHLAVETAELADLLQLLSDKFTLATKPLTYMATQYLPASSDLFLHS